MKLAKEFLGRFRSLTPPNDALRRVVADAVRSTAGVPVTKKDISIERGIAYVQSSSVAKSAIRTHRAEILEHVFSHVPKARDFVRDIR